MSNNPKVSVVMSVYNDAEYLRDSVSSVLRQESIDFEFIVIDDGSTDESGELLNEYAAKDSRLIVIHQSNQGLTRSLITACSMARGCYIARQDADDVSFSGRLKKLADELDQHPGTVMVASATVMIGPKSELLVDHANTLNSSTYIKDTSCHGSWMFRREIYEQLGGYRWEFRAAQDVDLRFRLEEVGAIRLLSEALYAFRVTEHSISARSPIQKRLSRLAEAASEVRRKGVSEQSMLADAAKLSTDSSLRKRFEPGTGDYFIGRCLYAQGDRRSLRYLWAACKSNPFLVHSWLAIAQALLLTKSQAGYDVNLSGIIPRRPLYSGREVNS